MFSDGWVEPLAQVLKQLGSEHVLVVHAEDGLDEISIASPTRVAELRDGQISTYTIQPEDFGMSRASLADIRADDALHSLAMIRDALANQPGPVRDTICLNAGAAIYAAGLAATLAEGVERAHEAIASGAAEAKLEQLIRASQA